MRTERKIVTVLFADIKSSIDLVASRDPEQAGDILTEIVREMSAAVRAHGGVVNQILGDGIMALFGAPVAIEDHAANACRAALEMRSGVQDRLQGKINVRIGIGSGEVVVRALAGDVTLHYGATGEAVHFASRMEQIAAPDQIVLTPATLGQIAGLATVRSLGPVAIKGWAEKMEVFELLGMAVRRARAIPRKGASGSFVGRGPELTVLQGALDEAASGHPRAVRVIAEAGLGKSRLVSQFTTERLPDGWALSVTEAVPHRQTSYGTIVDLMRQVFQIAPEDGQLLRQDKVLAAVGLRESEAEERIVPGLAELLGLQPLPGWSALEPRERRTRSIAACAQSLQEASRRRPRALVVEDAHWLDPESAECIQRLGDGYDGLRLLTIATERPPDSVFTDARHWIACRLPALDGHDASAFLARLLLHGPDVPALERLLMEHTQGNPLFIEECLEALAERGELERVGERYRLHRPVEALRIPAGLRALLDARVDRLPSLEKDVLQAAAVVGTSVRSDLLRRVANLDSSTLDDAVARLCRAGFLVEIGPSSIGAADGDVRQYGFRHGLFRETAYDGILRRTRARMHQAVLAALEERSGDEPVDLLAEHAHRAESWGKAVRYARQAGIRALDRYANPESARFFRQALLAAERLPDGAEKEKQQLDLHIQARWPLFRLGHVRELLPHLHSAAELAARHDDPVQLGQSYALQSHGYWLAGRPEQAEAAAEAARALGQARGDLDLVRRSQFQRALVHLTSARCSAAIRALGDVVAHLGPEAPWSGRYGLDRDLLVTSLGYVARAHALTGDFPAAEQALQSATAAARSLNRPQAWIYVHVAHGVLLLSTSRPQEAVGPLESADAECVATDMRLLRPVAAGFLALAYAESGQLARGVEMARTAVDDAERMGFLALQPLRLAILAEAHLLSGNLDEATDVAGRAAALAAAIREPGASAYAAGLRGEIHWRRGGMEAARASFRAGLEAAETLNLRPLARLIRQRLENPGHRAHPWLDGVAPDL
ncbi:MAG: adenylate/guanylate cyclase domain-containing protein [Acetobacteraceae bacterium]|nr:adenylate/guanylate cyclase domain-containing protein [Acetobacteraceae bacterium]